MRRDIAAHVTGFYVFFRKVILYIKSSFPPKRGGRYAFTYFKRGVGLRVFGKERGMKTESVRLI